jgi:hypothetical protein
MAATEEPEMIDYGSNQGREPDDGEPLTREESLWVWSIIWTFTIAPVVVLYIIARHL